MHTFITILFILCAGIVNGQTLGGSSVYNFLKFPNTPQLSALGSINISNQSPDIGLVFNNPALLRPAMHAQLNLVFNSMYAGIRNYHFSTGLRMEKIETNLGFGVHYFHYGNITQTDASGNIYGNFRPFDYVVQASANRSYGKNWHYGISMKFIRSNYGEYRSSGIAIDAGLTYSDSSNLLQAAMVLKNMGSQLTAYNGTEAEDLPFDIQLGISKRLKNAPLQFSLTAHHLHRFDIRYHDSAFNNENGFGLNNGKKFTIDKIFRHLIFATQLYLGDKVEISAAYNHLRRNELNIGNSGNGLNGFSLGAGVLFKKIQLRYARSYYQNNAAYNQLGINLRLNEYFGFGR